MRHGVVVIWRIRVKCEVFISSHSDRMLPLRKCQLLITHALLGHYHAELHEAEAPPEAMPFIGMSQKRDLCS